MNYTLKNRQAVVIGASMGGLLAARALADHYGQVLLLERDALPPASQNRKGVPQGLHAHGLLARGREVLEQLFPGLSQALVAQGAEQSDIGEEVRWFHQGGYHRATMSGMNGLAVSRPALEAEVRARVLALPNVRLMAQCDALSLEADATGQRVTGVRLIRRAADSTGESLRADLVVDAAGRGSRSPTWLEALGYHRPVEEHIRIGLGYATRVYRRDPHDARTPKGLIVAACPPNTSAGVLLWQEGQRFVVTLAGYFGQHPPSDESGFLSFARGLPTQEIAEAIAHAHPLTPITTFAYPASVRRRYERLQRFPTGYLVFGDGLCSFNPIYGQGMTVCALEALALQACLCRGDRDLARRFFRRAAQIIDTPWRLAAGSDLRYPAVEAPRDLSTRFVNWYVSKLHAAAREDSALSLAFLKVINLVEPPSQLVYPAIGLRVLWGNLRRLRA